MSSPHSDFPSQEEGLSLHVRLCDLDPTATADFCRAYFKPLAAWLGRRSPDVDPHLLQTAAEVAVMTYLQRPQAYKPDRLDLAAYLRMAARRDLSNLLRGEQRHHHGRVAWSAVELGDEGGNFSGREEEPSVVLERQEETEQARAILAELTANFTPEEKQVLELMLAGERSNRRYAEVLGLTALPVAEQDRQVKRVKDRITKRLERGGRHD